MQLPTASVEGGEQVTGKRGREKQTGSVRRRVKRAREARDAEAGVSHPVDHVV